MSLKDNYASRYYCTPLDIVQFFNQLVTDDLNLTEDSQIDPVEIVQYRHYLYGFIKDASSIINTHLVKMYNGMPTVTPYAAVPVSNRQNSNPASHLLGLSSVGSDAAVDLWKIKFTSITDFTVSSNFSGAQGTGNLTTKFESTNGDIVIDPTTDTGIWNGNFAEDDIIWINTYNRHEIVVTMATMYATSLALDSLYAGELPNQTEYPVSLRKQVIALLNKLADPTKSNVTLDATTGKIDYRPIELPYVIDIGGYDVTDEMSSDYDTYEKL